MNYKYANARGGLITIGFFNINDNILIRGYRKIGDFGKHCSFRVILK